jgi:hypothetical protein
MFVRHQDGGEFFRRFADAGEALADLQRRKARIHENAGFIGFQIGAIAVGTTAENGELNGHTRTLATRWNAGKFFWRANRAATFSTAYKNFNLCFMFRSLACRNVIPKIVIHVAFHP